jgi:RHS repeat-associated protein
MVREALHENDHGVMRVTVRTWVYQPNSFVPLAMILEKKRKSDNSFAASSFFANNGVNGYSTVTHREILYYDNDHLGTPQRLIDQTGNVRWQANQDAWGRAVSSNAQNEIGFGNGINSGYVEQPIRFQGQYYDEETGLHYNRYRYYDPHSGRYLSQDPIGVLGGFNFYQYPLNPTGWVDPLGLWLIPLVIAVVGGLAAYGGYSKIAGLSKAGKNADSANEDLRRVTEKDNYITDCKKRIKAGEEIKDIKDKDCSRENIDKLIKESFELHEGAIKKGATAACYYAANAPATSINPLPTTPAGVVVDAAVSGAVGDVCK